VVALDDDDWESLSLSPMKRSDVEVMLTDDDGQRRAVYELCDALTGGRPESV